MQQPTPSQQDQLVAREVALWEVPPRIALGVRLLHLARRKPIGVVSLAVVLVIVLMAVLADVVSPYDPLAIDPLNRLQGPSTSHPFGTDTFGRDVLSRIIHGSRVSLIAGVVATAVGTAAGAVIGIVSGYIGGKLDLVLQRITDSIMALPGLILLMALTMVLGASLFNIVWALCIYIIPRANRIARGAVISVKENTYIEAAQVIGASPLRILTLYVLPNVMAPIIVIASITVGAAIIIEASLSFLGLGVPPPDPTWGNMLSREGRQYMEQAPWLAWFPGLAITITVLAFNLLGDTLRDIMDPRLRGM